MIDPVGTGWSRAAKPDGGSAFWGVHRDAKSMAKVIALYVAKNSRSARRNIFWAKAMAASAPPRWPARCKTTRASWSSGIVMVSPMIEGALQFGGEHFALGAALQLPSLAAAELERKGTFSTDGAGAGRAFRADRLSHDARRPAVARRCGARVLRARCPDDRIAGRRGGARARLHRRRLCQELRAGDHKIVSHYDATFALDDPNPESASARGPDPISRWLRSRLWQRLRRLCARRTRLQDRDDLQPAWPSEISGKWDWHDGGGHSPPSAAEDLRRTAGAHAVVPAA